MSLSQRKPLAALAAATTVLALALPVASASAATPVPVPTPVMPAVPAIPAGSIGIGSPLEITCQFLAGQLQLAQQTKFTLLANAYSAVFTYLNCGGPAI
jgi:hypothetical protein